MLFSRVDCVAFPKIHWRMLRLGVSLWTKSSVVKVRVFFRLYIYWISYTLAACLLWFVISSWTDSFPGIPEVRVQWGEHTVLARLWGVQKNQDGPRDDLLCEQDLLRVCPNRSAQTGKQLQAENQTGFFKNCKNANMNQEGHWLWSEFSRIIVI